MRPPTTYSTPRQPLPTGRAFSGLRGKLQVWNSTHGISAVRVSEAFCRLGARLGNWNDAANGQHVVQNFAGQRRFVRPLRWHLIDRVAGWLYVAPERRRP